MVARIQPNPHTWPPKTFRPRRPPLTDPVPWWTPLAVGLVTVAAGVCLGFGIAAGWSAWEAMW